MQPKESWNDRTSLNMSPERYRKVLKEYYELVKLPRLEDSQASRVYEILELAEKDNALSFLVNEIDELTYQNLGFNEEDNRDHFKDEVSKVQEIIPEENKDFLRQFALASRSSLNSNSWEYHYSFPRVEMVYDPSFLTRIRFEKSFFYDKDFLYSRYGDLYFRKNGCARIKYFLFQDCYSILASFFNEGFFSFVVYFLLCLMLAMILLA